MFAKNKTSEQELLLAFKQQTVLKYYLAEVVGKPAKQSDIITGYLVKDSEKSQVKVFKNQVPNSVKITTKYKAIKSSGNTALLEVQIFEGKTHQIRAHLASINLPLVGDGKYGKETINRK